MEIKAIETVYKGYRMRSRLEARYAVLFDALNIKWEYEKEGYDLGKFGWHLPDFWIPNDHPIYGDGGCWVEIKGSKPNDHEKMIAMKLAEVTKSVTFIAYGLPGENPLLWYDRSGAVFSGENSCLFSSMIPEIANIAPLFCRNMMCGMNWMDIGKAIKAAKQSRFEHGQFGSPSEW